MGLARSFALCILLLVLPVRLAVGQEVPVPPLTGPVIDQVGVLPPQARQELERELWALKRDKGSEVVVLIVPSTKPDEIEQFSIRVVDTWKIGRKGIDDGALLLVAVNDRRVRIEVGRGLEGDVPDVKAFRIIDEMIVPRFRQGDLPGGIMAGASALVGLIRGVDLPAPKPGGDDTNGLYLFVILVGYTIGVLAEVFLGLLVGVGIGGLIAFVLGSLLLSISSGFGIGALVAMLVFLLGRVRPTIRDGGYRGRSRHGSWTGGWGSGGSFGGGSFGSGGSFSGGGSSGRW
jgi:uncharacterized protein